MAGWRSAAVPAAGPVGSEQDVTSETQIASIRNDETIARRTEATTDRSIRIYKGNRAGPAGGTPALRTVELPQGPSSDISFLVKQSISLLWQPVLHSACRLNRHRQLPNSWRVFQKWRGDRTAGPSSRPNAGRSSGRRRFWNTL